MSEKPDHSLLRQAIDPNGTLPSVDLVPPENWRPRKGIATDLYEIRHEGVRVGSAQIQRDSKRKENNFSHIKLDDEHRGKGFGMATYLAAIDQAHGEGHAFRTHEASQTDSAKSVWDKFIATGLSDVIVVEPLVIGQRYDDHSPDKYAGHIRIEPQQPAVH